MNHPSKEEWMEYLYGELHPPRRGELRKHLAACSECAALVETWQTAMADLDRWKIPGRRSAAVVIRRAIQLAAAAAVLVFAGYGIGRLAVSPGPDVQELRVELETSLKATLEPAIRQALRGELTADWQAALAATGSRLQDELAARTLVMSSAATERLLAEFIQWFEATRTEEQQAILAILRQLEARRLSGDAALRDDLVTLAALTEDEFLRTRRQMATLVASSEDFMPVPDVTSSPDMPDGRRLQ